MLFGVWTRLGLRKQVLDGGVYWRHLANAIEPSMCGCDAGFLSNFFDRFGICKSGHKQTDKRVACYHMADVLTCASLYSRS